MDIKHKTDIIECSVEFLSIWDCNFILADDGVTTFEDMDPIESELKAIELFLFHCEKLKLKKGLQINFRAFDKYVKLWLIKLNSMKSSNLFLEYENIKSLYKILFKGDYLMVNDLVRLGLPIHTNHFSTTQIEKLLEIQCSLASFLKCSIFFLWSTLIELPTFYEILALKQFKKIVLIEWVLLLPFEKEGIIEVKEVEMWNWQFRKTVWEITEEFFMGEGIKHIKKLEIVNKDIGREQLRELMRAQQADIVFYDYP
jgi:hypothetical protein